jgi:hypothetical protein
MNPAASCMTMPCLFRLPLKGSRRPVPRLVVKRGSREKSLCRILSPSDRRMFILFSTPLILVTANNLHLTKISPEQSKPIPIFWTIWTKSIAYSRPRRFDRRRYVIVDYSKNRFYQTQAHQFGILLITINFQSNVFHWKNTVPSIRSDFSTKLGYTVSDVGPNL